MLLGGDLLTELPLLPSASLPRARAGRSGARRAPSSGGGAGLAAAALLASKAGKMSHEEQAQLAGRARAGGKLAAPLAWPPPLFSLCRQRLLPR